MEGLNGHQEHLFKMIEIFEKSDKQILLHCFLDGRDSSPLSGIKNMKLLLEKIRKKKCKSCKCIWQILLNGS